MTMLDVLRQWALLSITVVNLLEDYEEKTGWSEHAFKCDEVYKMDWFWLQTSRWNQVDFTVMFL